MVDLSKVNTKTFWSNVKFNGHSLCWEWTGSIAKNGYGEMSYRVGKHVRQYRAHRVAYQLTFGDLAPDKVVMHLCNNPRCVSPYHLKQGTQAENMAQMAREGRASHGESHQRIMRKVSSKKLTDDEVCEIREYTTSHRVAAEQYGVSVCTISNIRAHKQRAFV